MGRLRLSRTLRAFTGCLLGIVVAFIGLVLVAGIGWALVVAGAATAAAFALLYDVDDVARAEAVRRRGLP